MKMIKSSKVLLASSILAALAGCGSSDDFTPEAKVNNSAPVHGGDISVNFHEKDAIKFISLLGTPAGTSTGEGVATDADGNFLSVTDVVVQTSGDRAEEIEGLGIGLQGNEFGISPVTIAPLLDTDETHTIVVNYNITDGANKAPRMATFTITGEDFAPVIANNIISNYTKDAGVQIIDGLANVSDADNEVLTLSNLVAGSENPFTLPVTINGSNLEVDVASVENDIPDGQKVTFNFTYTVSDHRFDLEREVTINVLGVKDIAGAPLVLDYFLKENINETDGMLMVDLAKDIEEREGDAVIISEIMLDGMAYTDSFAGRVDGNTLYFNPNAYFDDVEAGSFKDFTFTMKVADDQGNMSDGERELVITVNGVESNLLAAGGMDVGFEVDGAGFEAFNCGAGAEITTSLVANGNSSFQMLGAPCYYATPASVFPDMEVGGKYYFHYNAYVGAGDASPYIMLNKDTSGTHNFWVGARPWHPANASWRPLMIEYDTEAGYLATANGDGETPMDVADQLRLFVMSAWVGNDGMPAFDDFNFTRYDNIEGVDILTGSPGSFEDDSFVPTTSGGGLVEVREDTNDASNKVLYVDTTGATEAVTISFPVETGAIASDGKYRVTFDVQYVNFDANKDAGTDPNINQWGGYTFDVVFKNADTGLEFTKQSTIWNGNALGRFQGVADETSHWWGFGADTDWSTENATVDFVLKGVGAQYIIDNIEIVRIP
ncbi:hypothetical protein [Paraglaciecola sp.]|uniref:hypothetical protein n=1 Tax=Paraglaciecola sp. TaxID=1920173 RepID=UPI003EF99C2C